MKKFGIEYQGFLLRFYTHRNYFNYVFRSTKLRKYAIRSLIWSYVNKLHLRIQQTSVNSHLQRKLSSNSEMSAALEFLSPPLKQPEPLKIFDQPLRFVLAIFWHIEQGGFNQLKPPVKTGGGFDLVCYSSNC